MASAGKKREIEVKLALESASHGRRLLRGAGFRIVLRRVHEDNHVFDRADRSLRTQGLLLRLRRAGSRSTLTFKGPSARGRYKSRTELELTVSDPGGLEVILSELGFHCVFRYEKYRTEYVGPQPGGIVMLDETPIGVFLELEGSPTWIERTASRLGFEESSYITMTYAELYEDSCRWSRSVSPNLLFEGPHVGRRTP